MRDLSERARTELNQELLRRSLDAGTNLHDRELYLLESVNLAANLEGMSASVRARQPGDVMSLLRSVVALKTDLNVLVAVDNAGSVLGALSRQAAGGPIGPTPESWPEAERLARSTLRASAGAKTAGFVRVQGRPMLAVAAPVCTGTPDCAPVGAVIVAQAMDELVQGAVTASSGDAPPARGLAIYDSRGRVLATTGPRSTTVVSSDLSATALVRRNDRSGENEMATLYAPLLVQGNRVGTLAVSAPTAPAFASARSAGLRLIVVVFAAMVAVVAIGIALSRVILSQVRPLLATNRALGRGDLSARAPVRGSDELGELAEGVNQMADELQAGYQNLELRVAERTEEIQRLLRERTEFFASISHEFRTPVAIILRQVELMRDKSYPKAARWGTEAADMLESSGRQLLGLINDILDLAEAESGGMAVTVNQVRLRDVVKDLRPTIETLAKEAGLRSRITIPRNLPAVWADATRLREIIVNLVDNAVKYTPDGGKFGLTAAAHNGNVEVSITDTGVGIPEGAERIFEPFYRAEGIVPQRGQSSSGLGLAITKKLVEAHGGEISFTRRPRGGTTFTFTLVAAHEPLASDGPTAR